MKPIGAFLTVLLIACATMLDAQTSLTLEKARASALANSRTLRKALLSVDSAQSNYESVFESYRLGAASTVDLLDAEAQVSASRWALIAEHYAFFSSFSALRTLAGYETEVQLTRIVP